MNGSEKKNPVALSSGVLIVLKEMSWISESGI